MHISTAAITPTSKGHRVWVQGLAGKGIVRPFVCVEMTDNAILLSFHHNKGAIGVQGKWRKVTQSKGGIVDLTSKKVTEWARGHDTALVVVDDNAQTITITRHVA